MSYSIEQYVQDIIDTQGSITPCFLLAQKDTRTEAEARIELGRPSKVKGNR